MKKIISLLFYFIFTTFVALAQSGSNDSTFLTYDYGDDGVGFSDRVTSIAHQPDGNIIVGGAFLRFGETFINRIVRLNAYGSIDPGFNPGSGFNSEVKTIVLQSDGKIIVGGFFTSFNGIAMNRIARLNADGSLDTSFNPGSGFNSDVTTLVLQPDGKIITGGSFTSFDGTVINRIARLNSNGSIDTSFNPGSGFDNSVSAIALQPDGKIIIGGYFTSLNGTAINRIARLNDDGSIDVLFNPGTGFNGVAIFTLGLQPDNKIIAGGSFTTFNGTAMNRIARLNADGSLDMTFNPGTGFTNIVYSLILQPDDKIIVGGAFTYFNGTATNRITRLNTNGSFDTDFNSGTGFSADVNSLALQPDGKIITGGLFNYFDGLARFYFARLNIDGTIFRSFTQDVACNNDVYSFILQPDLKIIAAGDFTAFNGIPINRIVRMNAFGINDTSFNCGTGFNNSVRSITLQSDGKIVAGGAFTTFNGLSATRIARLNPDGSVDISFNPGTGFNGIVLSIILQSDGKLLVGGSFTSFNGTTINRLARLNTDGSLDTSFDAGSGFNNTVYTLVLQPDGKIIAGGPFTSLNGSSVNRIARLNNDGSQDISFNIGTGFNSAVFSVILQPDHKIITGGSFSSYNGVTINGIIRLNNDGSRDTAFNPGTGFNSTVHSLIHQADGKIIAGGGFSFFNGIVRNCIAGLNSDGSLDFGFDPGSGFGTLVRTLALQPDNKLMVGGNFYSYNFSWKNKIVRLLNCVNSTATDIITSCDPYTWIDGNTYSLTNNTATYVLTNARGCDSIITLDLTINSTTGTDVLTSCDSYTWIDGNTYTSSNSIATYTMTNIAGCDSTVSLNLTINNTNAGTDIINACNSYTWLDGDTYTSSNSTATYVISNAAGCDSIVTLNLTINVVDNSVTVIDATTLLSNSSGAAFQWLDCGNSYSVIAGEDSSIFVAATSGQYAVEVTENGCVDTSSCFIITSVGIMGSSSGQIKIYPNPTNQHVTISLGDTSAEIIEILDMHGIILNRVKVDSEKQIVDFSDLSPGVYLIKIGTQNGSLIERVVKQ